MPHVLLVEDDASVRIPLAHALDELGHAVTTAATGAAALQASVSGAPDVVALDLGLPDIDGLEVLRMLRSTSEVPVIVETARDEDAGVVRTLDAGADDYVVKPFSARQLDARIRAVLRRTAGRERGLPVRVGGLEVDARTRTVTLDGAPVELTVKEFDLLLYLAERAGEVVPKRELLVEVWRQAAGGADKTIDVHLSWLRRKLGETAAEPRYLHTVRGVGVRVAEPADDPPRGDNG